MEKSKKAKYRAPSLGSRERIKLRVAKRKQRHSLSLRALQRRQILGEDILVTCSPAGHRIHSIRKPSLGEVCFVKICVVGIKSIEFYLLNCSWSKSSFLNLPTPPNKRSRETLITKKGSLKRNRENYKLTTLL